MRDLHYAHGLFNGTVVARWSRYIVRSDIPARYTSGAEIPANASCRVGLRLSTYFLGKVISAESDNADSEAVRLEFETKLKAAYAKAL